MNIQLAHLIEAMTRYDHGDPMRIQHFMKVHDYCATIATLEEVDENTRFTLEATAILHDIGIHLSEQKYGNSNGKNQEKEGPAEARKLLEKEGGYTPDQIERITYLIGHHHTYNNIDGLDYQILVEADFLVNLYEDGLQADAIATAKEKIFRTSTGIRLLDAMYDCDSLSTKE